MNKKLKAIISCLACVCIAPMSLIACGPDNSGGGTIDEEGNYKPRPGASEADVKFWISGDDTEIAVFKTLVDDFNALPENKGVIKISMIQRPSDSYDTVLGQSLASGTAPDIFYVGDSGYKDYAELGYLYDITDYVARSKIYKVEDMWDNVVTRYKYDVNTYLSGTDSGRYYGVPKDIGPTVVYYNETYFKGAGIEIISVAADQLDEFNAGTLKDDRGKTKSEYGISGNVKEKGYFEIGGKWYFNNQVPMSWDETVACAKKVQSYMRTDSSVNKSSGYGYFTEWWFNYGWSVGGNCIQQIPSDQYDCGYYYDFTLMDGTPNYIVADDVQEPVTVNKVKYNAGEIIEYKDKLDMSIYNGKKAADGAAMYKNSANYRITDEVKTLAAEGKLNQLPSQRDAFTEFVRLGSKQKDEVDNGLYGHEVTPLPTDIDGDAGKVNEFQYGNLGMLVDGRWNVTKFREITKFEWDVAPLPMYKTYYTAADTIPEGKEVGDIKVHGIEAGHSGSVALCIGSKTKYAPEAWKFIEYCAGERGQSLQAEAGFAIPLQKDLANKDVFLQPDKSPKNSKVFIRATEYEQAGDWWMLKDKKWIDEWANLLNGSVRNGDLTLSEFFNSDEYSKTFGLLDKYTANR